MPLADLLKIEAVSTYLLETDFDEVVRDLAEKYRLPVERASELQDVFDAILDEVIPVHQVPILLKEAFDLDDAVAKNLAADLVLKTLVPLSEYVPGMVEDMKALGVSPDGYTGKRVAKERLAPIALAGRVATKTSLKLDDVLLKRLGFLLQEYKIGKKTEESLKTFFVRAGSIGGMGLKEEEAQKLFAVAKELLATVEFASTDVQTEKPLPSAMSSKELQQVQTKQETPTANLPEIAPSHELATAADAPKAQMPRPVLKKYVKTGESVKPQAKISAPAKNEGALEAAELKLAAKKATEVGKASALPAAKTLEAAVALATEQVMPILQKKNIGKNVFSAVADKTIRGIQDVYRTRDVLETQHGFTGGDLATAMEAIAAGQAAYNQSGGAAEAAPAPVSTSDAEAMERNSLDKRFSAKTQQAPKESIEPIMPGARVSAARSKEEEIKRQSTGLDAANLAKAEVTRKPEKAKTELTVGSLPPSDGQPVRKFTDVRAANRLVGPKEELGTITPQEFRRLSTNPVEAVQKLEDLLTALQTVSYEERVKGVLAWRTSPLNQLYLSMAEDALQSGVSLPEVASRLRSQGQESLSPAEIKSLAGLNARLRF